MRTRMDHGIITSEDNAPESVSPVLVANPQSSKKEESDSPFAVSVSDVYEGPLDLLLDLIRKQDIDIYDIPIARITAQYLAYVEKIRELDVNVAADFIYMAAVLIHIMRSSSRRRRCFCRSSRLKMR
jgi:segregation and condensation protein A